MPATGWACPSWTNTPNFNKTGFATGPLSVAFPPGNDKRALSILIEADAARSAGLAAPVSV